MCRLVLPCSGGAGVQSRRTLMLGASIEEEGSGDFQACPEEEKAFEWCSGL